MAKLNKRQTRLSILLQKFNINNHCHHTMETQGLSILWDSQLLSHNNHCYCYYNESKLLFIRNNLYVLKILQLYQTDAEVSCFVKFSCRS